MIPNGVRRRTFMCLLATQPYIKILREVTSTEQKDIEQERMIYLYENKMVTKHREFPIQEVIDVSYRKIDGQGKRGLLYIHTSGGLYAYTVKTSTKTFIDTFKRMNI